MMRKTRLGLGLITELSADQHHVDAADRIGTVNNAEIVADA